MNKSHFKIISIFLILTAISIASLSQFVFGDDCKCDPENLVSTLEFTCPVGSFYLMSNHKSTRCNFDTCINTYDVVCQYEDQSIHQGTQARVFEKTIQVYGCCENDTIWDDFWNPGGTGDDPSSHTVYDASGEPMFDKKT